MTKFVIDTNVAISANGRSTHASWGCQLSCIEFLASYPQISIVLDTLGLIMAEYAEHLNYSGEPGVGDIFFKYLHDYQYSGPIEQVQITPHRDANRGFQELPENALDPSDRKFLAAAVVSMAQIVNATDSDWAEQATLVNTLGITLKQLCPDHMSRTPKKTK
ncbi:MAG: hypothetical protein VKK80_10100 [Prochlorothrix sp.]|nr:hypothetical protein [Prochlorothrix sp.]